LIYIRKDSFELIYINDKKLAVVTIKDLNIDIIRDYFLRYNAFDLYKEDIKTIE